MDRTAQMLCCCGWEGRPFAAAIELSPDDRGHTAQAGKCEDEDGCEEHTCNDGGDKGATCTDAAAPSEGFVCKCSAGFALGADKTSCADEDGCKDHTCNSKGDAVGSCPGLDDCHRTCPSSTTNTTYFFTSRVLLRPPCPHTRLDHQHHVLLYFCSTCSSRPPVGV